jgi:hypothetical protein
MSAKYGKPPSRAELMRRINRGEKLMNSDAVAAHQLDLGTIYRTSSGELALKPHGNERGVFKRSAGQ